MSVITLPNGIKLDPVGGWAVDLLKYAVSKGLKNVRVFLATQPDGEKNYLIVEGQNPVYEGQSFEAIAARLDIMALDQQFTVAEKGA